MMDGLLEFRDFSVGFTQGSSTSTVVHPLCFSVQPGETLAIVGESGSGKSVTALSILQLLPKEALTHGSIFFTKSDGQAIDLLQTDGITRQSIRGNEIGMVFQEPMTSLNPVLTCGYQVMESMMEHQRLTRKVAREKTIAWFKKVQLPFPEEMLNRYPHELSGGQKQRVMIAMALSCNPSLLIADEPTTALDLTVQKSILDLIRSIQAETRLAMIFITHDIGLVAEFAQQVVVMHDGRVVEQGKMQDVLFHPRDAYTKALLACTPANYKKGHRLASLDDAFGNSTTQQEKNPIIHSSGDIVLNVEHLSVAYAHRKAFFQKKRADILAVDDVSFQIRQGEVMGLVGESGCGKTTLVKALLQLVGIQNGSVVLNGRELTGLNQQIFRKLRRDLQIVFQDPYGSLNPRLTIGEAIAEPLRVYAGQHSARNIRDEVVELLESVQLKPEHFNRYPHQFSGGQRQRICIARALALNPSFLIFDESVSALDVSVQAQVLNLLNDLKVKFGFSAIFISHDLSVVHYISDRILVMHQGKIVEAGDAHSIYHHPMHPYTQQLVQSIPGRTILPGSEYQS